MLLKNLLEVDGIRLSFNNRPLLTDISIRCETGYVVGLLGSNGSGKSSLLKIIFGSHPIPEGIVRINGMRAQPSFKQPWNVGLLPQFPFLPIGLTLHRAFGAFDLRLAEFIERMPIFSGLEKEHMSNLSPGMIRLVEIFLLVKKEAMFTLLDEPFNALEPIAREQVQQWIQEEKSKKGFIITDHDYRSVMQLCDSLYLLQDGKSHICHDRDDLVNRGYLPA